MILVDPAHRENLRLAVDTVPGAETIRRLAKANRATREVA
jgi:hypothetical protein